MFIFVILGLMLGGVFIGHLLRNKQLNYIHKIIMVLICILLFLLGVEVGFNDAIIKNFHKIGIEAVIITLAAVLGSALMAWGLWRIIIRYNRKKGRDIL